MSEKHVILPRKRVAPGYLAPIAAVMYILAGLMLLMWLFDRDMIWCLVVLAVLLVILFLMSRMFAWYESACVYYDREGHICYEVTEIVDTLGHREIKYIVVGLDVCRMTIGGSLLVRGTIFKSGPIGKGKAVRRFKILDCTNQVLKDFFVESEYSIDKSKD